METADINDTSKQKMCEILQKSLAVTFTKIATTMGTDTVQELMDILGNKLFKWGDFSRNIHSVNDCLSLTQQIIAEGQKEINKSNTTKHNNE